MPATSFPEYARDLTHVLEAVVATDGAVLAAFQVDQRSALRGFLAGSLQFIDGSTLHFRALANRAVAEIGDIKPTTSEAVVHSINFGETYSRWEVIDSRGIFETTVPEGVSPQKASDQLKEDRTKYDPEVILHIISAPEVRTLEHDSKVFEDVREAIRQATNVMKPTIPVNFVFLAHGLHLVEHGERTLPVAGFNVAA